MSTDTPTPPTPRQKAREMAFQFVYGFDQEKLPDLSAEDLDRELRAHMSHFGTFEHSFDFALRIIQTTLRELKTIDSHIETVAKNWKFDRISAVDKAFLRIGAAELLFFKDVPASVTLNEIIELSKAFGEEDTPLFLNGILDPISKLPEAVAGKVASDS